MRLLGHPVHVILIHFPVALWPAHWIFHLVASRLPEEVAAVAAFWLLAAGCLFGWLAAIAGAADLLALWRDGETRLLERALIHAAINGTALLGFTIIAALEFPMYPRVTHGPGFLALEAVLVGGMFFGNYFGGAVVWNQPRSGG